MIHKLKFLFVHHFKLVTALNFGLTLYLTYLFVLKGFDKVNLYNIAFALKLVAYVTTLAIEKLFFAYRSYYYRNLGFSYRKLLGLFFAIDFLFFISLLIISFLWMSFI